MRIGFYSNAPWAPTGYGTQCRLFTAALAGMGHEVAILCNYGLGAGQLNLNGVELYPMGPEPFSLETSARHAKAFGAEVIVSLYDAWVLRADVFQQHGARWVPWFPVDSHPLPSAVAHQVREAWQPVAMSRHGQAMCAEQGIEAAYLPHAVDPAIGLLPSKDAAREARGMPRDRFVVGMVAANKGVPSRKAFPEAIAAFVELHRRHPEAILYLHTDVSQLGQGYNLLVLAQQLGVPEHAMLVCDQYRYQQGFPTTYMADVLNGMDVLLSPSWGEGFGIPIIEAQACGTPVIVGGWSAMPELVRGGYVIDRETEATPWWTPQGAYMFQPHVGAIIDRLEAAYQDWSSGLVEAQRAELSQRTLADYSLEVVVNQHLVPLVENIAERLAAESAPAEQTVEVI